MAARDPRVDAYVDAAEPFARPILRHLREVVHRACPEAEETIKWGCPHFEHGGILCGMAAFRRHCALTFPKGALVVGEAPAAGEAMGQFGRIASLEDLPPDAEIAAMVRRAAALNAAGVKTRRPARAAVEPHPALLEALHASPAALAAWERFAPGQRREYAEWVAEAKADATRRRRVAMAVEWIAEGKGRNWKHERR